MEIFFAELFHLNGAGDLAEFLWADYKKGVWDGDDLSVILKRLTVSHNMRSLGLQEYRQVATAFMEEHTSYKVRFEDRDDENIFALQAGHRVRATNMNYAIAAQQSRIIQKDVLHYYNLASGEWRRLVWNKNGDTRIIANSRLNGITNRLMDDNIELDEQMEIERVQTTNEVSVSEQVPPIQREVVIRSDSIVQGKHCYINIS